MARLSRRKLVAGMGGAPLLADAKLAPAVKADPVLLLCAHYGDLVRRSAALMRRWSDYEGWLGKHRNYYGLSKEEARRLPEARLLFELDDEYWRCQREGVRVLRRLRQVPARTLAGAIAKLCVVAEDIDPDELPSAHRVLLSAISDLRALERKG